MTLLNIEYVRLRTVNLEIFLDIYVTRGHQLRFRIFRSTKTFSLFCAQFENTHQSFAPNLSGEPLACQYSFQPANATMIWLLTSRYWDLDQLVLENYKINYRLRYEPSNTHTKAIYLAFMRSPYSFFVSRDSSSKTNRFATEIDCKTVGFFFFIKISKESGKAWRKESLSLVPDLLFDCSRVPEYAKIRTVLQSTTEKEHIDFISDLTFNDYIT